MINAIKILEKKLHSLNKRYKKLLKEYSNEYGQLNDEEIIKNSLFNVELEINELKTAIRVLYNYDKRKKM